MAQIERDGDHVPGKECYCAAGEVHLKHHVAQRAAGHDKRNAVRIGYRVVHPRINGEQRDARALPQDQIKTRIALSATNQ